MLAKKSNLIVKNKHVNSENLDFEFLAFIGRFNLKKRANFFFKIFVISYQIIPFLSLLENMPYINFLPNFLLLRPCTLLAIAKMTKLLPILYRLIKLFLKFG